MASTPSRTVFAPTHSVRNNTSHTQSIVRSGMIRFWTLIPPIREGEAEAPSKDQDYSTLATACAASRASMCSNPRLVPLGVTTASTPLAPTE